LESNVNEAPQEIPGIERLVTSLERYHLPTDCLTADCCKV